MKKDPKVLKQQDRAIKQIREELLHMLKAHFAKALGRRRSQATRWEHPVNPQEMDEEARLRFAQLIASHFWNLGDLEEYLDKVGWEFTNGEWEEAELYLKRDDLPWNVPRVGIADFVGRKEKLAELKQVLLAKGATAPLIILVEGMPGVGKTMLVARLLAEREVRARFRDKIVWVSMEPGLIGDQVDDLEKRAFYRLVEQVFPDQRLDDRYYSWRETSRRKVRDALKEKRTLLILDGVVESIDLDEWRMMDQIVGRLLVTTQRQDLKSTIWTGRVKTISVGVLGSKESRELLTRGNVEVDIGKTDWNWLLEILDGLPLALNIVNHLALGDGGFKWLVQQLKQSVLFLKRTSVRDKRESLEACFDLSYNRLDEDLARLFRSLSIFPQPFEAEPVAYVLGWNPAEVMDGFRLLKDVGLVSQQEEYQPGMHRLLYAYAGEKATESDEDRLVGWKKRFTEYYLGVTRRAFELWGQDYDGDALQIWWANLPCIDKGCAYAYSEGRGDLVLEYLLNTGTYLAFEDFGQILEQWWGWANELVDDEEKLAIGAFRLARFYLSKERPEDALLLARGARRVFMESGSEQNWVFATSTEAEALLQLGREVEAAEILSSGEFWDRVERLAQDDFPVMHACGVWQKVENALGEDSVVSDYRERASEARERWISSQPSPARTRLEILEMTPLGTDPHEAMDLLEKRMALAEEVGDREVWATDALYRVFVLAKMGRVEESEAGLREAELWTEKDLQFLPWLHFLRAQIAWAKGQMEEGEGEYTAAAEGFVNLFGKRVFWEVQDEEAQECEGGRRVVEMWKRALRVKNPFRYMSMTIERGRMLLLARQIIEASRKVREGGERVAKDGIS